ncbi:hypothetical protein GCM10023147_10540 [Tsukamurella soli]|uniref:Uncharacterized protein n=1 Tax=Tsukamurella soli TaxID=644556 RepID=A0ABP8J8C1_9ACTN
MTAASVMLRNTNSSAIAASSSQGTGAQNFLTACINGCTVVSGSELGPMSVNRRSASAVVSPFRAAVSAPTGGVVDSGSDGSAGRGSGFMIGPDAVGHQMFGAGSGTPSVAGGGRPITPN